MGSSLTVNVLEARREEVSALVHEDDGREHRDRLERGRGAVELEVGAEDARAAERREPELR
jgi:hypothetical protein